MTGSNFLANPPPGTPLPAPAPSPAPAYKAPVADGSNQGPQIGDRKPIVKPPAPTIAPSRAPGRQNNDRTSGMAASMGALADKMHPTRKGR